jgi:hypothetical protein
MNYDFVFLKYEHISYHTQKHIAKLVDRAAQLGPESPNTPTQKKKKTLISRGSFKTPPAAPTQKYGQSLGWSPSSKLTIH